MEETISLLELNQYIQQTLELNFGMEIWISCEFSNLKNSRGHYYVDLIQNDPYSNRIIAKSQGIIWKTNVQYIERQRNIDLTSLVDFGAEVKLKVAIDYHEVYGLKMIIVDIDPNYSLGQLEIIKNETIARLTKEGLIEKNRALALNFPIQNIAIISSETAAGYIDFTQELLNNSYGYLYNHVLFSCPMQGENVKVKLPELIDKICKNKSSFSAIIIIRGGGSKIDLSAFDEYNIAVSVANSTLPVLSGIGHEIDISVVDMVSYRDFKTPTAVAGFIIEQSQLYEASILKIFREIQLNSIYRVTEERGNVNTINSSISYSALTIVQSKRHKLKLLQSQFKTLVPTYFQSMLFELDKLNQTLELSSPQHILNMGYAIIEQKGKRIREVEKLDLSKDINIHMKDGNVLIKNVKK